MKKVFTTIGLLFFFGCAVAQNILTTSPDTRKWNFGGDIGLGVNSNSTDVYVAPRVGYALTENLEVALNVNYTFRKANNYKMNIFGVGPELSYYFQGLFANVSYRYHTSSVKNDYTDRYVTHNENALLVGGGYQYFIGGNTYVRAGVQYNLLYKKDRSIFSSAFMPYFGISVGL